MKYPNLNWAIAHSGFAHYETAAAVAMSETRFPRCLRGRAEFSPAESKELASYLGYPVDWLFQSASPPPQASRTPDFKSRAAGDRE